MPLWRAARTERLCSRSRHYVKSAARSTDRHSELIGIRTTAWMQEVEQRMEQLPSRILVRYVGWFGTIGFCTKIAENPSSGIILH